MDIVEGKESNVDLEKQLKDCLHSNDLAGKIGIELLGKINELTEKNKTFEERYDSQESRIKILEQENHQLRQQLQAKEDKGKAIAWDLRQDVKSLKSQVQRQAERAEKKERDQATDIAELTAENARLIEHRRKSAKQAEQLLIEFKFLKTKFDGGCETLLDPCNSLRILNHQYQRVSAQKKQLRKKSSELQQEVARTAAHLKEAKQEVETFRELCNEANHRAKVVEEERDELAAQLAAVVITKGARSGSIPKSSKSLFEEMELDVPGSSVGDAEPNEKTEIARACKRLRELLPLLKRDAYDSGFQSFSDYSIRDVENAGDGDEQENFPPGTLSALVEEVINLTKFDNVY